MLVSGCTRLFSSNYGKITSFIALILNSIGTSVSLVSSWLISSSILTPPASLNLSVSTLRPSYSNIAAKYLLEGPSAPLFASLIVKFSSRKHSISYSKNAHKLFVSGTVSEFVSLSILS